jgi:RNA polymerase sigma factor (sigma-70 family)
MANVRGGHFLRSDAEPEGPGVLTTLLRSYIETRDREPLDLFFKILYEDHAEDLEIQVHSYGRASHATVKEVIDESLSKLLEDVMEEKLEKPPESAGEHLKYLLRRKFIDRRRARDRGPERLPAHRDTIPDRRTPGPDRELLERESEVVLDARMEAALSSLPPRESMLIRLRMEGQSQAQLAKTLEIPEGEVRRAYSGALDLLMSSLATDSPTMVLRFEQMRRKVASKPKPGPEAKEAAWATRAQIEAALPAITERVRSAVERLHFQGISREELSREFGEETLEVLLRRGYDLLENRFKVSFPEAFLHADLPTGS